MNRPTFIALLAGLLSAVSGFTLASVIEDQFNLRTAQTLQRTCSRYLQNHDLRELIQCISPSLGNGLIAAKWSDVCLPQQEACQAALGVRITHSNDGGLALYSRRLPHPDSLLGVLAILPLLSGILSWLVLKKLHSAQLRNAMLQASWREKARVANQVLHDLKSPLAGLKVARLGLQGKFVDADILQLLEITHDRLRDLSLSLSDELKDPCIEPVKLAEVLQQSLREARAYLQSQGMDGNLLDVRVDPEQPTVLTDTSRLKRAIQILLHNAIEASSTATPQFVQLFAHGRAIELRDHGTGIDPFVRTRLGEWGLTQGKPNGSGRGWPTLMQFAQTLGWRISIACNDEIGPGERGTRVRIELPAVYG